MTSSTGTVVFNDAKLQAIDVVATERLGVGTLDPASNLHVVGNVHVTGNVNKLNFTDGYAIERGANVTVFGTTDVIQEITGPHARASPPLRKYPEVAMTSTNQAGYVISFSSADTNSSRTQYGAFDGIFDNSAGEGWQSLTRYSTSTGLPTGDADNATFTVAGTNYKGQWLKLKLPKKIRVESIIISAARSSTLDDRRPHEGVFLGSNDDTNWEFIKSFDINTIGYYDVQSIQDSRATIDGITNTSRYRYLMLVITKIATTNQYGPVQVNELEYYGYEETSDPDTSVDTTITSVFNLPDTTGVKLYIDGDKGSTPTDYSGEGHTLTDNSESFTGNAWSFTSLATSNVTMSTGDLAMEGTHPHSVSMWFNCANVTSNATLFHVGTAAGEGDAKSAISLTETGHLGWIDGGDNQFLSANTWHNLVYATQGAGGLRTCYLDGRKLGDVAVQDTFGDYPPFAMTGYSQGGYTVSASSDLTGYDAWKSFDDILGAASDTWISLSGLYSSGTYVGSESTTVSGTTYNGEWIQLELPMKVKLSHVLIAGQHDALPRSPESGAIAGSNDGTTWYLLNAFSSVTGWTAQVYKEFITNTTSAYKYFRLIVTNTQSNNNDYVALQNIRLYGHKENDTTRFPISSTVLKYPHIDVGVPRDNPAKRGYVVTTGSSIFSGRTGARAFDDQPDGDGWETDTSSYDLNNSGIAQTGTDTFGSYTGHWIKLELPRKIVVGSIDINAYWNSSSQADDRRPDAGAFLGSNDDSTWELIHAFGSGTLSWSLSASSTTTYETNISSMSASNTNAYKYIVFVITHKTYGGSPTVTTNKTSIRRLRYYGTEPEDVVARVGEGLDGRVANFRVYDKYLREEQALELWDAQKDQFGRTQSSVSVYRGHVGIGTTTPSAALTVMDEAEEMGEFPPRAMTADETYMEGHGVFKSTSSPIYNDLYPPYKAFDKNVPYNTTTNQWVSQGGAYDNASPNSFPVTSGDKAVLFNGTYGSWIQLEMPYKIILKRMETFIRMNRNHEHPTSGILYGSNDGGNTYERVYTFNDVTVSDILSQPVVHRVNLSKAYSTFAFQITKLYGVRTFTPLGELKFFGTRQGQSTLHDGQLTLTKNLTVPRIGPAFDADDTPRRDRLVVEYNTSTNPVEDDLVQDTSGRGNDGIITSSVTYDSTSKEFDFAGDNDWIESPALGWTGAQPHSVSVWIKLDVMSNPNSTSIQNAWTIRKPNSTDAASRISELHIFSNGTIEWAWHSNNNTTAINKISAGQYYHIVCVYNGGAGNTASSRRMWINGVEETFATVSSTASAINFYDTATFAAGYDQGLDNYDLDGKMSSIKLYDTALTAEEVKRLYDMGRCDEGHHVVNFSKTRVGIGLGDGEAPRAALDVRGSALVGGNVGIGNQPTNADDTNPYPDAFPASPLHIHQATAVSGNDETQGIRFSHPSNIGRWNLFISDNNHFRFAYNGLSKGYVDQTDPNAQMNFTGQHRTFIKDIPFSQVGDLEGLIVSSDQNKYIKMSGGIEAGSNAITTNESLPLVSLSNIASDKKCFGVISASEDPEERSDAFGSFVTPYEKELGDTRVYINSVGEGAIWVVNTNGSLESGDYITTSNVAGYGQKQDSDSLKNYTVAKITMDCDFEPATQPIQRIKRSNVIETHYTGMVPVIESVPHEFVTTVVGADDEWSNVSVSPSDVTYAEWSNLEANVQNTYTLTYTQTSNVVYDVKYTKTTTANVTSEDAWDAVHIEPPTVTYAEWSNLEANVQNTYTLTYTMTTKVEATEAIYSNLSSADKAFFVPTYYQMVEQTVDAEYPGAVKHETVTDKLGNVLDEHGQLQWEDDPSGATEKAYRIRYLTADGTQTDEANCVHRAAFVGCTYHCG